MNILTLFIFGGLFLIFIIYLIKAIYIIRPYEVGVIERLGKYRTTLLPGLRFIIPFIDVLKRVDMRELVMDVAPQEVITKDNVVVTVDGIIYFQVVEAPKALYNVVNFTYAIINLAQTTLRNIIGELDLDQTLSSREVINARLREILDEATEKWGVKVTRVELRRIDPPKDVTEAMHRQMKAERERRAAILEAEGVKQSEILKAEGERQSKILKAEGEAQAIKQIADAERYRRIAEAEGEAQAIVNIFKGIHTGEPTKEIIALRYFEALKAIADGKANKIFIPVELSSIASLAGILTEVLKKEKQNS